LFAILLGDLVNQVAGAPNASTVRQFVESGSLLNRARWWKN